MSQVRGYSETEERFFETPLHYFFAQIQQKKLLLALDLSRHEDIAKRGPMLMNINLENLCSIPIGHPFDSYLIKSYTVTKLDGREQEVQLLGQDRIRDWWRKRTIIAKAHAKTYKLTYQVQEYWSTGMAQYTQVQRTKYGWRSYLDIVMDELQMQQRLYDAQIQSFNNRLPA